MRVYVSVGPLQLSVSEKWGGGHVGTLNNCNRLSTENEGLNGTFSIHVDVCGSRGVGSAVSRI